jgi:hypothetical protein
MNYLCRIIEYKFLTRALRVASVLGSLKQRGEGEGRTNHLRSQRGFYSDFGPQVLNVPSDQSRTSSISIACVHMLLPMNRAG